MSFLFNVHTLFGLSLGIILGGAYGAWRHAQLTADFTHLLGQARADFAAALSRLEGRRPAPVPEPPKAA